MQQVVKGKEPGVLVSELQGRKAFPRRVNLVSDLTSMNLMRNTQWYCGKGSGSDWWRNRAFKTLPLRNACCWCMAGRVFILMVPTILCNVLFLHGDLELICQIFQFVSLKYIKSLTVSVAF